MSLDPSMVHWGLILAVVAAVFGFYSIGAPDNGPFMPMCWVAAHLLLKVLVTAEACRPFIEDKHNGTLELLLCTPLAPSSLVETQQRRLRRVFALPMAVLCVANYSVAVSSSDSLVATFYLVGMFLLPMDGWALSWTALHRSLQGTSYAQAVFGTLCRVLLPGWIALFALGLFLASHSAPTSVVGFFFVLWGIACGIYDVWMVVSKRLILASSVRRLAAR